MRPSSRQVLEVARVHAELPCNAVQLGAIEIAELAMSLPPFAHARNEMVGCSRENGCLFLGHGVRHDILRCGSGKAQGSGAQWD